MSDESHSLFAEIEDSLRAERLEQFWRENYRTIIGCCVAVLLGTALSVGWRNYQDNSAQKATLKLIEAQEQLDAGKTAEAAASFGNIADAGGKEASFARVKQAQAFIAAGKQDKADGALALGGKDDAFAGLMLLLQEHPSEDALKAQTAPDKPFHYSALERLALLQWQRGQKKEAAASLNTLVNDPKTPASLRDRAGQALHVMQEE
jgi:hypothetical protein